MLMVSNRKSNTEMNAVQTLPFNITHHNTLARHENEINLERKREGAKRSRKKHQIHLFIKLK